MPLITSLPHGVSSPPLLIGSSGNNFNVGRKPCKRKQKETGSVVNRTGIGLRLRDSVE